jgi:hypothetical protein
VIDLKRERGQNKPAVQYWQGAINMNEKLISRFVAALLFVCIATAPGIAKSQQAPTQQDDGAFYLGSFILSLLYFPVKLVTCVGTQAGAAVAYTATYGVAGSYDGDTNGKDIGETARRSCTGDWIITPQQVKKDYGN